MRFPIGITVALLAALLLSLPPRPAAGAGHLPLLVYRGGAEGKVVFDHQLHASKGSRCNDCHTDYQGTGKQLFATSKQGLITFADHSTATKCFACHNGKNTKENFDECRDCHRKGTAPSP
jgi:c(7)-type cytochrome triheme protein